MNSTVQPWNLTGVIVLIAVVVASLALLASISQSISQNGAQLWLDELRLRYQSKKLSVPIPLDLRRWRCKDIDINDDTILLREVEINNSWWNLLRPSFRARGYQLYILDSSTTSNRSFAPDPVNGKPYSQQVYPYGRRLYKTNNQISFGWSACIRAARDSEGRDVCIRLVCSKDNPTKELEILRYLRRPEVLNDPRNITIPILEELEIYGLIFVVMPQWDAAWVHDFGNVTELMDAAETFLKYLAFIHEHRIAHMDLHDANTAINTVIASRDSHAKGLREPPETHYAVYDFGESYMYPINTRLDSVQETKSTVGWGMCNWIEDNVPFNPFCADVGAMGLLLESYVRVLVPDVPQVAAFFHHMLEPDPTERPTAHEALREFQELRASLTPEQISAPVRAFHWHPNTGMMYKPEFRPKNRRRPVPALSP